MISIVGAIERLDYGLDDWGIGLQFPLREEIFVFDTVFTPDLGTNQTPIQWVPGATFPGVKRSERAADSSSQFIA
jgi:hypothetical protein